MVKNRRKQTKVRRETPQCNLEECQALLDLLFEATKENNAYCARLCGVDRRTWLKWNTAPPTEWYWPMVLRAAIKHVMSQMIAQRRATTHKFRRRILEAMSRIPKNDDWQEEIAEMAYTAQGAELHLRTLLARRGKFWSEIQLAANNGGYSKAMLRTAARNIGIVKRQEGFGEDKDSFWRLPTEEDD